MNAGQTERFLRGVVWGRSFRGPAHKGGRALTRIAQAPSLLLCNAYTRAAPKLRLAACAPNAASQYMPASQGQPGGFKSWAFVTFESAEAVANIMAARNVGGLPFPHLGKESFMGVEFPDVRKFARKGTGLSGGAKRMATKLNAKTRWARAKKVSDHSSYITAMVQGSAKDVLVDTTRAMMVRDSHCFFLPEGEGTFLILWHPLQVRTSCVS